jgi:hypothetical protein
MFAWRASVIDQIEGICRAPPPRGASIGACARAGRRGMHGGLPAPRRLDLDRSRRRWKAERVAVVAGDFGWNDVGSWAAMAGHGGGRQQATRAPALAVGAR